MMRLLCIPVVIVAIGAARLGQCDDPKRDPAAPEKAPPAKGTPESVRQKLEKDFAALLNDSVLTATFSTDGKEDAAIETRCEIGRVSKLKDDRWMFQQIVAGDKPAMVPLVATVVWTDQTPTLMVDDAFVPGAGGKASFRMVLHKKRFAGTWQGEKSGGHLLGRIEPQKREPPKPASDVQALNNLTKIDKALQALNTANFKDNPLKDCLGMIFTHNEIPYVIEVEDLLQENIEPTRPTTLKVDGVSVSEIVDKLLRPLKMCLVIDDRNNLVRLTTLKAAWAKNWKMHQLKPDKAF